MVKLVVMTISLLMTAAYTASGYAFVCSDDVSEIIQRLQREAVPNESQSEITAKHSGTIEYLKSLAESGRYDDLSNQLVKTLINRIEQGGTKIVDEGSCEKDNTLDVFIKLSDGEVSAIHLIRR
jgi:hypothetical protein